MNTSFSDEDFNDQWYVSQYISVYRYKHCGLGEDPRKFKFLYRQKNTKTKRKLYFDDQSSRFNIKKIKYIDLVEKQKVCLSGRIWEI